MPMASAQDTEDQRTGGIMGFTVSTLPPRDLGGRAEKSVTSADLASVQGQLRELAVGFPTNGGDVAGVLGMQDRQRVESLGQGTGRGEMCPACSNLLHTPVTL